jgi:ATP-dependent Clp protease adapter protein ClpS
MHLLDVLLGHAPVREVLTAAGNDPDRIVASMQTWTERDRHARAFVAGHAYRAGASKDRLVLASSDAFELVVDDAIRHVAPDKPVDSLALLLSLLEREVDRRGLFARWLARPITPGPDSFLLANGVRWAATVMAVLSRRDTRGRSADVPSPTPSDASGVDVVLINDDTTPFDFVVATLREVLHLPAAQAWFYTTMIDQRGEAAVARVEAERAAELITRIESRARAAGFPLVATVRTPK